MYSLLTEGELQKYDDLVLKKLQVTRANYSINVAHPDYGRAFVRYILFREWPGLIADLSLTPCELFYNRYFWVRRCAKDYQSIHGSDAGIEQQVFQTLEQAPPDTDWKIIESIDKQVG